MKLNNVDFETYFNNYPDKDGYFGRYGGVYVDDKLKALLNMALYIWQLSAVQALFILSALNLLKSLPIRTWDRNQLKNLL